MELLSSILTLVVTETRSYATYQLAQLYFILVEKKKALLNVSIYI